jgi:hypothetical protein
LQISYQVLGEGGLDLLYFVGLGSHIDLQWDAGPPHSQFGIWSPNAHPPRAIRPSSLASTNSGPSIP